MDINNIMIILGSIIAIIIIGTIFKISITKILKLVFNSILGGVLIYFINKMGVAFNIHIGLNVVTSVFVGIFGIPGALLLLAIKIF